MCGNVGSLKPAAVLAQASTSTAVLAELLLPPRSCCCLQRFTAQLRVDVLARRPRARDL
jgi:hypothetical protein